MMNTKIERFPLTIATMVSLCGALGIGAVPTLTLAQSPSPSPSQPSGTIVDVPPAIAGAASGARNGYAEKLTPTVKRKAGVQAQPYLPIKQQNDQDQVPEIEMFVGESRVFPAPNVGRIAVGNGQIMTAAALDKKEVLVFANGAGTSSLFVWNEDGRYQRIKIHIVPGDTSRVAREVAAFLGTIAHAKTSIVGDKVIVEGDNLSDADLAKIDQLEKRYPQLVNFTNRVGWEQMVMMDVKVVEFPKSELREIGLKWNSVGGSTIGAIWEPVRRGSNGPYTVNIPSSSSGLPVTGSIPGAPVYLPGPLNVLGALNLGLSAQLNLLEQEGKASILAEPQLSARNGAKASFLAGGEFPYSVSNLNGVTIIFKPYGIKLDITPKVDRNGVIRATILAEVSSIDASVTAIGGPALLTRRTDTEFNVRAGQTIVLAGLLQRNISTDIDKVPLLGDLPVLGALFRSKRFQNKETELVVFVTPTVVDSQSPGLVDRVNRTTERLEQQMGRQPYLSAPLQPGASAADFNRLSGPGQGMPASLVKESDAAAVSVQAAAPATSAAPTPAPAQAPVPTPVPTPATTPATTPAPAPLPVTRPQLNPDTGQGAPSVPVAALPPSRNFPGKAAQAVAPASLPLASDAQSVERTIASGRAVAPPRYRVMLGGLAVRVAPDVNSSVVLKLEQGRLVTGLPQESQGYWTAVDAGGQQGWVATQWLLPQGIVGQP